MSCVEVFSIHYVVYTLKQNNTHARMNVKTFIFQLNIEGMLVLIDENN